MSQDQQDPVLAFGDLSWQPTDAPQPVWSEHARNWEYPRQTQDTMTGNAGYYPRFTSSSAGYYPPLNELGGSNVNVPGVNAQQPNVQPAGLQGASIQVQETQHPQISKRRKTDRAPSAPVPQGGPVVLSKARQDGYAYMLFGGPPPAAMRDDISRLPPPHMVFDARAPKGIKRTNDQMLHESPAIQSTRQRRTKKALSAPQTTADAEPGPSTKLDTLRQYNSFPANATSLTAARALCQGRQYMRWQPTDHHVPTSAADIQNCAERLYNATVDLSGVELPLAVRNGNRLELSMDYDEAYIAWRCYEVVDYAIRLHRDGCTVPTFADRGFDVLKGRQILDKAHRGTENPVSYRDLTFDERMADMEYALTIDKTIAADVLDAKEDLGYVLVLAPWESMKVKATNAKQNKKRAEALAAERAAKAVLAAQINASQHQNSVTATSTTSTALLGIHAHAPGDHGAASIQPQSASKERKSTPARPGKQRKLMVELPPMEEATEEVGWAARPLMSMNSNYGPSMPSLDTSVPIDPAFPPQAVEQGNFVIGEAQFNNFNPGHVLHGAQYNNFHSAQETTETSNAQTDVSFPEQAKFAVKTAEINNIHPELVNSDTEQGNFMANNAHVHDLEFDPANFESNDSALGTSGAFIGEIDLEEFQKYLDQLPEEKQGQGR